MGRASPLGQILALIVAASPLLAHAQLDPDAVRTYGGRYAVDCANPAAPRVVVSSATLAVEQGTQRMTGGELQASVSAFGQSPPDGFIVMLMSTVRGRSLNGTVLTDATGPWLQLEGDPQVNRALGSLTRARFRDCDDARVARVLAQRAADRADARRDQAQRASNAKGGFGTAYRAALGPLARERWIAEVAGYDETPESRTRIGGEPYRVERACKPHDCFDNNLLVLYSPAQGAVYGKVLVKLRPTFIGQPPPAMQATLERLWRAEFRQGQ